MKNRKYSKGFTLVELLIVIAIIGVLAGLLYPAIAGAMTESNKMKSMNNAKNISTAWMTAVRSGRSHMIVGRDIYAWASELAEKNKDMNDAAFWILDFDLQVMEKLAEGASMPLTVANRTGNNMRVNPEFKAVPISWEVANKADPNGPSNAPLVWTRGLKPSGEWDKNDGVFKDEGGHIAFQDAHVEWYPSLRDENRVGLLRKYGETERTFNISQAIRGGTQNILKSDVGLSDEYEDE